MTTPGKRAMEIAIEALTNCYFDCDLIAELDASYEPLALAIEAYATERALAMRERCAEIADERNALGTEAEIRALDPAAAAEAPKETT